MVLNSHTPEARLEQLGIMLPNAPSPVANFVNAVRTENMLFVSGQGPTVGGKPVFKGKLGGDVTDTQGYEAARLCAINAIAAIKTELTSLSKVKRIVKLLGFVASTTDFHNQPYVVNGASDLLVEVFGERGKHTRSAIGTNVLPFDIPVEIEMLVEVT